MSCRSLSPEASIRLHASSLNTLEHIAMFRKDFCVDVGIVVFKMEVAFFRSTSVFVQKRQLSQNSKEKSTLGP